MKTVKVVCPLCEGNKFYVHVPVYGPEEKRPCTRCRETGEVTEQQDENGKFITYLT